MSVREFTGEDGREWRAWDIKPQEIHPATKAEDYLADCYITGWIVFETVSGDEKRRLCPWPMNWSNQSVGELRKLLSIAELVAPQRVKSQFVSRASEEAPGVPIEMAAQDDRTEMAGLHVVRSFRYPHGDQWTVSVVKQSDGAPVLRFSARDRSIDLTDWSSDWADQPDDGLIWMLRRAAPRDASGRRDSPSQHRRWDDPANLA